MRASFLRRPHGAAEITADSVRIIGVLCIIVAAIGGSFVDVAVFALVLPGLLAPRFIRVRPAFDIVYGVVLIAAGWSAVLDLYTSVPGWDIAAHIVGTGVIAAMAYLLLARLEVVPAGDSTGGRFVAAVVLTVCLGLAASAVWEMAEWAGHTFIDETIFVAYADSIGDMAAGGLGSLLAGLLLRLLHAPLDRGPQRAATGAAIVSARD